MMIVCTLIVNTLIVCLSIVIAGIGFIDMMLHRLGFILAAGLPRNLLLRRFDRSVILRHPCQQRFRSYFSWFLAGTRSHSGPSRGSNSSANACPLAATRHSADHGAKCGTATDLGHI